MKRIITKAIAVTAIITLFGAAAVYAACGGNGRYYVDNNNDGICDNYNTSQGGGRHHRYNYIDSDDDGVCDNYGSHCGGNGRYCRR